MKGGTMRWWMLSVLSLAAVCPPPSAQASEATDPCVGWRRDGTGVYPETQPPVKWSATENVLWKTPLPGRSNASPILVGDRIFVTSETSLLLCLSAKDGSVLWSSSVPLADALPEDQRPKAAAEQTKADELARKLGQLEQARNTARSALAKTPDDAALKEKLAQLDRDIDEAGKAIGTTEFRVLPKTSADTGYATPTPTSDGKNVYVAFGTGVVACYDLEGHRQWVRRLETQPSDYSEARLYGVPESPLLAGGHLLIHFLKLTALDPATGKTLWEAQAGVHFASLVRVRVGDFDAVLTACGDVFRITDGKPLASKIWPSEGLPLETCCSPVVHGDTVYLVGKGGGAVRLKPSPGGGLDSETLWESKAIRDWCVASPVYADGLLYVLQKGGKFVVLDAASGKPVYKQALDTKGANYPSIVLAGPYLYASSNDGETVVMKPGREYQEVGRNALEPFTSSLVFSGTRMYVRGQTHLYCIGTK